MAASTFFRGAITACLSASALVFAQNSEAGPFQGNGVKIGEVTSTTAIFWTRLTDRPEVSAEGIPFSMEGPKRAGEGHFTYAEPMIPDGHSLADMQYIMPGAPGAVRITCTPVGMTETDLQTDWMKVDPDHDFIRQTTLEDLTPGMQYQYLVESRSPEGAPGASVQGIFHMAPAPSDPADVSFTVITGQDFWRRDNERMGHTIYTSMLKQLPDFFVHTGDIEYFDKPGPYALNVALARFKWNRIYAMPFQRAFHNQVASYFMKDDHEAWQNDCWPTMENDKMRELTFEDGLALFREQAPMGVSTYRTRRWGKDLQIWLVEGRDFRSPNTMDDGPDKTIWGADQKAWFKETVAASDATYRILISPTPLVGPDRESKNDNHANAGFTHEGDELRQFISTQKNMFVVCGDRHWQYVTEDPKTGVREYSCGPTSMAHAGGFREDLREPMHKYLNIVGGYLSVILTHEGATPHLTFRHHAVDGTVLNEEGHSAK